MPVFHRGATKAKIPAEWRMCRRIECARGGAGIQITNSWIDWVGSSLLFIPERDGCDGGCLAVRGTKHLFGFLPF